MKKCLEFVHRVESPYVGKDCVQIMIPYESEIVIFNKDGIVFSHFAGSHILVNKYLEDERRKQFPYSNIPTHCSKYGLFKKINFVNQLFDFETPYFIIADGDIVEDFAVKDKDEVLLVSKCITDTIKEPTSSYVTREKVEEVYSKSDKKLVFPLEEWLSHIETDTTMTPDSKPFPSEENIRNSAEEQIIDGVKKIRDYITFVGPGTFVGTGTFVTNYFLRHPLLLDYIEQSIDNLDLTNMRLDFPIKGSEALILRTDEDDISMQYVKTSFVSTNNYRIDSIDLPVSQYTLEQLRHLPTIKTKTGEQKIPLKLNPDTTEQDIQEAKQKVIALRK